MRISYYKIFLWAELIGLFLILPPLLGILPIGFRIPILLTALVYLLLHNARSLPYKQIWHLPKNPTLWGLTLTSCAIIILAAAVYSYLDPNVTWLALPKLRPQLWLLIMLLYPLLSVLPQELIWRYHLLETMQLIIPHKIMRMVISSVCFGWMHVIYGNFFAIFSTIALGWILCLIYYQGNKSIWPIWLIHAIAGQVAFTFGIGAYFYGGSPLDFFQ